MRILVKDVMTSSEALEVLKLDDSGDGLGTPMIKFSDNTPPIVQNVLEKVSDFVDFKLHEESYWRVQHTPERGIWWHKDTGSHGHMAWCTYGVSVLLTDENGGRMKYRKDGIEEVVEGRERLGMYIHSSEEEHMVEAPDSGKTRSVLLFFI